MSARANKNEVVRRNILDISLHLAVAAVGSLFVYQVTARLGYVCVFVCGGVLVDLDHLFDYCYYYRSRFMLKEFLACSYLKSGRSYVLLHSWELVAGLWIAAALSGSRGTGLCALSLGIHLAVDALQRENPMAYLLTYRIWKKFSAREIFPESRVYLDA